MHEKLKSAAGKAVGAVKEAASDAADVTYKAVTGRDAKVIRKKAADAAGLRDALKKDDRDGYGY